MKTVRLLPLVLLSACAAAAASTPIEDLGRVSAAPDAPCDVQIVFSSACCGINGKALDGVRATVSSQAGVSKATEWTWGREGEKTICVKTASPAAADALYASLAASRYPTDNHATTTVSSRGRTARLE